MNKYLFTTLPSNDLGLLTRSLPIARELRARGCEVAFCSPATAPRKLVSEAGFENLFPNLFPYHLIAGEIGGENLFRFLRSSQPLRDTRILVSFLRHMAQASTAEIVDIDHFMSLFGMWHEELVRANVEALVELFGTFKPTAIVDFWNPFACIAARVCHIPLITVIQADMHPASQGFIWWKETPSKLYTSPIPATNAVLTAYHLPTISKMGELLLGDKTLVLGIPETDPLPNTANVTYIGPILWQKQIDRLQYDLYNHEKTRSISEEDMDALRKRAAAALDKQEQKKAAKRKVLTEEQLKKSKFWRMMNGEREKK